MNTLDLLKIVLFWGQKISKAQLIFYAKLHAVVQLEFLLTECNENKILIVRVMKTKHLPYWTAP